MNVEWAIHLAFSLDFSSMFCAWKCLLLLFFFKLNNMAVEPMLLNIRRFGWIFEYMNIQGILLLANDRTIACVFYEWVNCSSSKNYSNKCAFTALCIRLKFDLVVCDNIAAELLQLETFFQYQLLTVFKGIRESLIKQLCEVKVQIFVGLSYISVYIINPTFSGNSRIECLYGKLKLSILYVIVAYILWLIYKNYSIVDPSKEYIKMFE